MAKSNLAAVSENAGTADPEAPFGRKPDGTPRKRAARTGTRTNKPIHVLFQVTDKDGNAIQGASLKVLYAGKDTNKVIEAMDKNPGVSRTTVQL